MCKVHSFLKIFNVYWLGKENKAESHSRSYLQERTQE